MFAVFLIILNIFGVNHVSGFKSQHFFDNIIPLDYSRALKTDCTSFNRFTDLTSMPYTVVMFTPSSNSLRGYGVALKDHWLLTTATSAAEAETDIDGTYVYQNIDDVTSQITNGQAARRKIREINKHTDWTGSGVGNNIAVVRVCPKFEIASYVSLPSAQSYNCMKRVFVFTYGNSPLSYFCNYIGTNQMCLFDHETTGYTDAEFFCIEDSSPNGGFSVYGDEANNSPIVLLGDDFVGFVVGIDSKAQKRYAAVIKVESYALWIEGNTNED